MLTCQISSFFLKLFILLYFNCILLLDLQLLTLAFFNLMYTLFVSDFKLLCTSLLWKFTHIMADDIFRWKSKWNHHVISIPDKSFFRGFCLLSLRFSTYFLDFFIIRLFPKKCSFLIFLKISFSFSRKLDMLWSEDLA